MLPTMEPLPVITAVVQRFMVCEPARACLVALLVCMIMMAVGVGVIVAWVESRGDV